MRQVFWLSVPVVLTLLAQIMMGTVDLWAVGRVSQSAVGAVGIANALYAWFMVFGIGLLSSLDYFMSRDIGAKNSEGAQNYLSQGLLLGGAVAIPLTGLLYFLAQGLESFGINHEVAEQATPCIQVLGLSLLPFFMFFACRMYLQANGRVRETLYILLFANIINAISNYILVFGKFGFPALGATGAAWSTVVSRVAMMLAIFWVLKRDGVKINWTPQRAQLKQVMRMGLPAAMTLLFEVGVFSLVTGLAGRLSQLELAAHQIVLNIASTTFMVPLGIGSATAVLVGQAVGRGDFVSAKKMGWNGMILGIIFMGASCIVMLGVPRPLLALYTNDSVLADFAGRALFLAAIFQLSDGIQAVGTGALRGLGNTRFAMFSNLIGHWVIGLPVAILLGFHFGLGLKGLWIGLTLGLTVVALAILWKWVRLVKLHREMQPISL